MTEKEMFAIVGIRPEPVVSRKKKQRDLNKPDPWSSSFLQPDSKPQ